MKSVDDDETTKWTSTAGAGAGITYRLVRPAALREIELKLAGWVGMLVPAGTPAPVLARLESEARAAIQSTGMRARFQVFAMSPIGSSSAAFRRDVEQSTPVYERLIRSAGVKPE